MRVSIRDIGFTDVTNAARYFWQMEELSWLIRKRNTIVVDKVEARLWQSLQTERENMDFEMYHRRKEKNG